MCTFKEILNETSCLSNKEVRVVRVKVTCYLPTSFNVSKRNDIYLYIYEGINSIYYYI